MSLSDFVENWMEGYNEHAEDVVKIEKIEDFIEKWKTIPYNNTFRWGRLLKHLTYSEVIKGNFWFISKYKKGISLDKLNTNIEVAKEMLNEELSPDRQIE